MTIRNIDVVASLQAIMDFATKEKETGALLSAKGEYKLAKNKKVLLDAYEPYQMALEAIGKENKEGITALLEETVEIGELAMLSIDDFKDGITLELITKLDFMMA